MVLVHKNKKKIKKRLNVSLVCYAKVSPNIVPNSNSIKLFADRSQKFSDAL